MRINLVAAIQNLHKVQDQVDKKEMFDEPRFHKAVPSNVDYEKLGAYLLYRPKRIIKKTLENTTQMTKAVINTPLSEKPLPYVEAP